MSPKSDIDSNLPYSISVFLSHLYFFQISQHLLNMVCMGLCFLTKYPFLISCSWLWETMVNPTSLLPSPPPISPLPFPSLLSPSSTHCCFLPCESGAETGGREHEYPPAWARSQPAFSNQSLLVWSCYRVGLQSGMHGCIVQYTGY